MNDRTGKRTWFVLLLFLAGCFAAAGVGVPFTTEAVRTWYAEIDRPSWTPPNWMFGPVWTALYAMMAVAAWRVWRRGGFGKHPWALALFFIQLALNAAWTPIFFGARAFGAALIVLVALWAFIVATLIAFWKVTTPAGALMLPYLLWVSYASTLNAGVWWLNR